MRLIDADAFIGKLSHLPMVQEAIKKAVDTMPTIDPEQRWIACEERLPDEDCYSGLGKQFSEDVLISVFNADDDEELVDYGHTVNGEWYSDTTDEFVPEHWKVTAWMPLPEPYMGDE